MTKPIRIITGGQYGSEGKGSYIHHIAGQYKTHVRTGGPQAGHSIKMGDGTVYKLTTVPVGAFTRGTVSLIAPTSVLDLDRLFEEMAWAYHVNGDRYPLVIVDPRCTVLIEGDKELEENSDITARLGSTAHGVGAARVRRIDRRAETADFFRSEILRTGAIVEDTIPLVRNITEGVLIEAAQGQLLSLFSGAYPFCTSAECGPAQAFVDAGFPLYMADRVQSTGIFRTLPIRVGGNSGPMGGTEMSWDTVAELYGDHIAEERTTVTNKIRRISTWDPAEVARSVAWTQIDDAVLTFVDYPFPEIAGTVSRGSLPPDVLTYVKTRALQIGVPIVHIGTGFGTYIHGPF